MASNTNAILAKSKEVLHNAENFTQNVTGHKTAPHRDSAAPISYHAAKAEPTVSDELKAKADNINQYAASK